MHKRSKPNFAQKQWNNRKHIWGSECWCGLPIDRMRACQETHDFCGKHRILLKRPMLSEYQKTKDLHPYHLKHTLHWTQRDVRLNQSITETLSIALLVMEDLDNLGKTLQESKRLAYCTIFIQSDGTKGRPQAPHASMRADHQSKEV